MVKVLLYFIAFVWIALAPCRAQKASILVSANPAPVSISYYVSLEDDETIKSHTRNVIGTNLSLKYHDRFGITKEILLELLDWRRERIASLSLNKNFGLNYYNIDLQAMDVEIQYGKPYYCLYMDDKERAHEMSFVLIEPSKGIEPAVNIFVNPIHTDCDNLSKSAVAFFGDIKGGKSPYRLTWYVINKMQNDLMFLPKEELLQHSSESPMISVDAFLDYYVMLHVEDACGAVGKQMVHVLCEEEGQQVNTVYVQPLGQFNRLNHKIK